MTSAPAARFRIEEARSSTAGRGLIKTFVIENGLAYSGGMSRRAIRISVSRKDRKSLDELLSSSVQPVRVVLRALVLLHLAEGSTAPDTAHSVKRLTPKAVRSVAHRYQEGGLDRALYEKARPGAAQLLSPEEKQRIVAMVCANPPEGHARWTVRLIAEEAVRRKLVPRAGRETIRMILQSHDLKPWREKNVVRRGSH
jgi:putative transposase